MRLVALEARQVAARWLARVALLLLWSLVAWGTLLLVSAGWASLDEGFHPAVARLLPSPAAPFWAWLNALSAALALAVWAAAALVLLWLRRIRPRA